MMETKTNAQKIKDLKSRWGERAKALNEEAKEETRPDNKVRLYAMASATMDCLRELHKETL
jgi:hypothetical protein